jgi:hypothetical protein
MSSHFLSTSCWSWCTLLQRRERLGLLPIQNCFGHMMVLLLLFPLPASVPFMYIHFPLCQLVEQMGVPVINTISEFAYPKPKDWSDRVWYRNCAFFERLALNFTALLLLQLHFSGFLFWPKRLDEMTPGKLICMMLLIWMKWYCEQETTLFLLACKISWPWRMTNRC